MFQQKSLAHTKQDIAERMLKSERKMAELRQAADSIRVSVIHKLTSLFVKCLLEMIKFSEKRGNGRGH